MIFENKDFTLKQYEKLCATIKASSYDTITFNEYFEIGNNYGNTIILRHDIDENIRFALDVAKIESKYGIKATYYFRLTKKVFVPKIMNLIKSFNHEIGYHYETVDSNKGDMNLAIDEFSNNLSMFRQKFIVKTVCMHGKPLSKYDNKKIWDICNFSDFNLLGEPYLSLDYNNFQYFSDSGRSWVRNKNKIKDKIDIQKSKNPQINSTNELREMIRNEDFKNICILTHPERWNKNDIDYITRYFIDSIYIIGKFGIIWRNKVVNLVNMPKK